MGLNNEVQELYQMLTELTEEVQALRDELHYFMNLQPAKVKVTLNPEAIINPLWITPKPTGKEWVKP